MARGPQRVMLLIGEDDMNVSEATLVRTPGRGVSVTIQVITSGGEKPRHPDRLTFNVSNDDAVALARALELLTTSGRSPG